MFLNKIFVIILNFIFKCNENNFCLKLSLFITPLVLFYFGQPKEKVFCFFLSFQKESIFIGFLKLKKIILII